MIEFEYLLSDGWCRLGEENTKRVFWVQNLSVVE